MTTHQHTPIYPTVHPSLSLTLSLHLSQLIFVTLYSRCNHHWLPFCQSLFLHVLLISTLLCFIDFVLFLLSFSSFLNSFCLSDNRFCSTLPPLVAPTYLLTHTHTHTRVPMCRSLCLISLRTLMALLSTFAVLFCFLCFRQTRFDGCSAHYSTFVSFRHLKLYFAIFSS